MQSSNLIVHVTDAPFYAKGDGITNDRQAIQDTIEFVYENGGGTVVLTADKTFLSGGIILKSNINLHFENGAVLLQSPNREDYVKPADEKCNNYIKYQPSYGHNFSEKIKWSHYWYWNYPMIFAPKYSHNFSITGNGTIKMMEVTDTEKIIKICPIGFFRCNDFVISDIHIANYHSYAIMPFTCNGGLFENIKIDNWSHGNGDGICLMNCQDIRITGCEMFTGDDSVYIFSSYNDPRKSEWWDSDNPQPSLNIEVDHNNLKSNHCKAFGMILWGLNCPDLEKIEVRDVYVHDNYFETMGNWLYCPYTDKGGYPPVTHMRFENNMIDGIEANFFETEISDMNYYHSTSKFINENFAQGRVHWSMKLNEDNNSVSVIKNVDNSNENYGHLTSFDKGECAIYQGLYFKKDCPGLFKAKVRTSGVTCRIFLRNLDTQELITSVDFNNTEWEEKLMNFSVPEDGNYHIGIESGDAKEGFADIADGKLGYDDRSFGNKDVIFDRGKMIFRYSDNLFER